MTDGRSSIDDETFDDGRDDRRMTGDGGRGTGDGGRGTGDGGRTMDDGTGRSTDNARRHTTDGPTTHDNDPQFTPAGPVPLRPALRRPAIPRPVSLSLSPAGGRRAWRAGGLAGWRLAEAVGGGRGRCD